jgi:hypothetical protein
MAAKNISDLPTNIALADAHVMEVQQTVNGKVQLSVLKEYMGKPNLQSVTSSATVTPVTANQMVVITAQAAALTLANPTGTWVQGQSLRIRLKDNGTARAITFGANYRAMGVALPTTTVINKTMYMHFIYNSTDTKFDLVQLNQEA